MFLLEDGKRNIWRTIKEDVTSRGMGYTVEYCIRIDGCISMKCNRNSADLCIQLEDIYNCIKYIKLLLEKGFVHDRINGEKNIATNKHYNTEIFREAFEDDEKYFHGNNWWEKDLITVMEFLIVNSSKEVIKKYTGDRLKSELNKLSINCLDAILKEAENEKSL